MRSVDHFCIKTNACVSACVGLIYLATASLIFWTSNRQSVTLLVLIVLCAATFGLQCLYSAGALRDHTRCSSVWNMQVMFSPLTHLYFYSAICGVCFVKVLAKKFDIDLWTVVADDPLDFDNFMLLIVVCCLVVLAVFTLVVTRSHYRSR